ncbi:MAG: hypothetical protein QM804_10340 [Propionicimonas sp.]
MPISYTEVEMLVGEVLLDPGSRLAQAIAATPAPVDPAIVEAEAETMADYRARYGFS